MVEATTEAGPRTKAASPLAAAQPIAQVDVSAAQAIPTGIAELDRVLGGGLIPGAVILLAGEPGVGKSTLLLEAAASFAEGRGQVLYLTAEESAGQVRLRAERLGALAPSLLLAAETDLARALGLVAAHQPSLLVVDSVQTIASAEVEGTPGGMSQVREVAGALIALAKSRNLPVILVGHVTKEGSVAGPRTLEHLVDVVCQFEGERHSTLRLLRAAKNRYGPTDELGCFEMTETGLIGLADPSGLFLSHLGAEVAGSCVAVTLDGRRPMALELQALITPSTLSNPRRTTSGLDSSRLSMILAVLHRHAEFGFLSSDVYASTVGGARAQEPATDLALALALCSAGRDQPVSSGTVVIGEVGLAGDVRQVTGLPRRVAEAARLGFRRAVVPVGAKAAIAGTRGPTPIEVVEVGHLSEAILATGIPIIPGTS